MARIRRATALWRRGILHKRKMTLEFVPVHVCPINAVDKLHPFLKLESVEYGLGIVSIKAIPRGAMVMRSPVLIGARFFADSGGQALMMLDYLQSHDLLQAKSPAYSVYLAQCLRILAPRHATGEKRLLQKLCSNQFGPLGNMNVTIHGLASLFNHSCIPNCTIEEDPVLRERRFYAASELEPGELFISYIPCPVDSRASRQLMLAGLGFVCECEACVTDSPPSLRFHGRSTAHCWQCGSPANVLYTCACAATYCSARCRLENSSIHKQICPFFLFIAPF